MPRIAHLRRFLWPLFVSWLTGCAHFYTPKNQYAGTDRMLQKADYVRAFTQIEAAKNTRYKQKDRVLFYLDAGMLRHYAGDWEKSNEYLSEAERGIEELYSKSVSKAAASFLLNDNALAYSGEDYENIYLNLFKSLNYLHLNQPDDAFVEIRRADDKLKSIESKRGELIDALNESPDAQIKIKKGDTHFRDSALDRYLSLLMYRTENRPDEARIDLRKIDALWQKQPRIYPFRKPALSRALTPPEQGTAKLNIICFSGQGIEKEAATAYLHTEQDTIIIAVAKETEELREYPTLLQPLPWPGITAGLHVKFQYPVLKMRGTNVRSIRISVNEKQTSGPDKIEDLGLAAKESWKTKMPIIFTKTLTRVALKTIASEKAKAKLKEKMSDNPGGYLAIRLLMDVTSSATENADLRAARFFPAEAHVGELELPPGTHQVVIDYLNAAGTPLFTDRQTVTVQSGQLNLIESFHLN
jgi:hypothetical protein